MEAGTGSFEIIHMRSGGGKADHAMECGLESIYGKSYSARITV